MPCPIAREVGELLNLTAGTAGNRTSTAAAEASGAGGKIAGATGGRGVGGKKGGRSSSSLGNRWLHDVLEVAETLKAERVEIVLDEKVQLACKLGWLIKISGHLFSSMFCFATRCMQLNQSVL